MDPCDDSSNDADVTLSDANESGTNSNADGSDTDTSVVGEDSSGDDTDVADTNDAHINDHNLQCEPLDETWMCSSGSKNHSLCIKFCTAGLDFSHILFMTFVDFSLCESNAQMVQQNTKNVCASKKSALGLKKVKYVRSVTLYQMATIRVIFQI